MFPSQRGRWRRPALAEAPLLGLLGSAAPRYLPAISPSRRKQPWLTAPLPAERQHRLTHWLGRAKANTGE